MTAKTSQKRLTIDNPRSHQAGNGPSYLDKTLGSHTTSVIVAVLFIITLTGFMIYVVEFKDKLADSITTCFTGLLSGLAGFFVASLRAKK